jgi:hypothetical protein
LAFICVANVEEARKENSTLTLGFCLSKVLPKVVKVAAKLEAANTVRVVLPLRVSEACDGTIVNERRTTTIRIERRWNFIKLS